MTRIRVGLAGRSYDVLVGRGLVGRAGGLLRPYAGAGGLFICSSARVARLHGAALRRSLARARLSARWLLVPDGERAKTLRTVGRLLAALARARAGRDACVAAFGGGTVGDTAGFAAAVYARGIRFVQIPTTLEAQVDAAIGGKTGVDLPEGKNLAGAFHQPRLVLADPALLGTLPARQLGAGLAEVVKYGVIAAPELFAWIERNAAGLLRGEPKALERAVVESARIKARIVSRDERESGRRAILNFGHTAGHALEAAAGYRGLLHGEAVAIGMVVASRLSARMGLCPRGVPARIEGVLRLLNLPVAPPGRFGRRALARSLLLDKKRVGGGLRLVLTRRIGAVTVRGGIDPADVLNLLET